MKEKERKTITITDLRYNGNQKPIMHWLLEQKARNKVNERYNLTTKKRGLNV